MSFKIISIFLSGTTVKWNCCGPCGSDAPPPQRREWFKVSLSALWLVSQVWPRPDKVGSSATPWRTSAARRSVGVSSYLIFQDKRNYGGYTRTDFSLIWEVFVYHWVRTPQIWRVCFLNFASPIFIKTCLFGLMQSGFSFLPFLMWRFQTTPKTSAAGEGGEYHILTHFRSRLNEKDFWGEKWENSRQCNKLAVSFADCTCWCLLLQHS